MTNLKNMSINALSKSPNRKDLIYDSTRNYFIDKQYAYARMGSDTHHSIGNTSLCNQH